MTSLLGGPETQLTSNEVRDLITTYFSTLDLDGRSLCLVVPDATRVCPLPLLLGAIIDAVDGRVSSCVVLVALGTHAPMSDAARRDLGLEAIAEAMGAVYLPLPHADARTLSQAVRLAAG